MNLLLFIQVFFLLNLTLFSQSTEKNLQENDKAMKVIFSQSSFHNIKTEDAHATAQILANHIKKLKNLQNDFNVEIVTGDAEIIESCSNGFDMILLTTEEYLRLKKKLPLEPFCVNYTNSSYGYVYQLIVNKNDNINDIAQLKGETIYIQTNSDDQAATKWLNKLLKDAKLKPKDAFFKEIILSNKATNVLLPVFFNKAKACIVTNASFNLLKELNPGISNQTKIIYSSEPLILGITCLNSQSTSSDNYKVMKDILPTMHENQYGKQLLQLFGADKLILFREDYLKSYYKIIE
ncbi:MAG: PhnD/SsuA/transferrin family substrate-binding protein [Rhizobiaceae bacterium]